LHSQVIEGKKGGPCAQFHSGLHTTGITVGLSLRFAGGADSSTWHGEGWQSGTKTSAVLLGLKSVTYYGLHNGPSKENTKRHPLIHIFAPDITLETRIKCVIHLASPVLSKQWRVKIGVAILIGTVPSDRGRRRLERAFSGCVVCMGLCYT
jgi:hypothetical protein